MACCLTMIGVHGTSCTYDYGALTGKSAGPTDGGAQATGGRSGGGGGVSGTGGDATARAGAGGSSGEGAGSGTGSGNGTAVGGGGGAGGLNTGGVGISRGGNGTAGGGIAGGGTAGTGGAGGAGGLPTATGGRGGSVGGASGTGVAGRGGASAGGAGGEVDPDLVLRYAFDESAGGTARDSSNAVGSPRDGMLLTGGTGGGIAFSTTHQVGTHAVSLTGDVTGGGYVTVPSLHALAPASMTIAAWIYPNSNQRWQRVFDIGNDGTTNFALATRDNSNSVRFVIRVNGGAADELINTTTVLSLAAWHHVVVVLRAGSPYAGDIFIDGALAGTNTAMTLHAAEIGVTTNNFLGRSQFTVDPYFNGLIDDFRVYRRALTATEITALFAVRQ